jgi:threonyl-tRNA synthetase
MPGWLSPIQIYVIPVSDDFIEPARKLADEFLRQGLRAHLDNHGGSLSKRIHFAHKFRPFAKLIVGEKELASGRFNLQLRDQNLVMEREKLTLELLEKVRAPD